MPKPPQNEKYRQGFSEIFEYFERLPGDQKVRQGKDWDAKIGNPPYNTLKAYLLGQRPTRKESDPAESKTVITLVEILVNRQLLEQRFATQFARDLSDGHSIIRYLPPIIEITSPQPPLLLKSQEQIVKLHQQFPDYPIGYQEQKQAIESFLNDGDRVVVYGQPGAGKTALAAQIVQSYLIKNSTDPKKYVLWMETGYGNRKSVEGSILVKLQRGSVSEIAFRTSGVGLLVLDNVWNEELMDWVDELPRSVSILITSREPLNIKRRKLVVLDGLKQEESLKLLEKYADISYENDEDAIGLCERLGHLPLALKLVGSQLAEKHETPASIANNIIPILQERISGNVTYASLIEQNFRSAKIKPHELLEVKAAFRTFGALFNRKIPYELLQKYQVCAGKQSNELILAFNNYLIHQNIVQVDKVGNCYRVNDVIFALSNKQCSPSEHYIGIEACKLYLEEQIGKENRAGFTAIWDFRHNLLGAVHFALNIFKEQPENNWFEDILWLLASKSYFDAKGYTLDWLYYLKIAAQIAEDKQDFNRSHYFWAKIGNGYGLYREKLPDALAAYNRALKFAPYVRDENPVIREAVSLSLIAMMHSRLGNLPQTKRFFDRALEKGVDYPLALSQIYEHMGRYSAELKDDLDEARQFFNESLHQASYIDDIGQWYDRCFYAHINLGEVELLANNPDMAVDHIQKAQEFANKSNKDDLRARAAREMGEKKLARGNHSEARESFLIALEIYKNIDDDENKQEVQDLIETVQFIS